MTECSVEDADAPGILTCYKQLSKPGLNGLVVVTTGLGYLLGVSSQRIDGAWGLLGGFDVEVFLSAIIGTTLLAFAAAALNQVIEVERDCLMERTRDRPLPRGAITRGHAIAFGLVLAATGAGLLFWGAGTLTAALGLGSFANYLFVYTPLKHRSSLNTLVGAVTGAVPPMMGWAAATGSLEPGAWVLFGVLFLWQIPHFLAIAWIYREDYARGGYHMLPLQDPTGDATATKIVLYSMALLPMSFCAVVAGLSGWIYLIGAGLFGLGFLYLGVRFYRRRTEDAARRVFRASLVYLPALFLLMLLDPTSLTAFV